MFEGVPKSYRDPFWSGLASMAEQEVGLPEGLLQKILTKGERSNADQVSSAGARTPFQVIPETRQALIKKYGVDAYASPENAAKAAALLLKEGLDRNSGSVREAVGEYIGGVNRKNWGPVTQSYINRVAGPSSQGGKVNEVDELMRLYEERGGGSNAQQKTKTGGEVDELMRLYEEKTNANAIQGARQEANQAGLLREQPTKAPMDVPTDANLAASRAMPKPPETSFLQKIGGGLEAAAALATGATSGLLGGLYSTLKGGMGPKPSQNIPENFQAGMEALTYSPKTQAGKDILQGVGSFLNEDLKLPPVLPIVGPQLSAVSGTSMVAPKIASKPVAPLAAKTAAKAVAKPGETMQNPISATEFKNQAAAAAAKDANLQSVSETAKAAATNVFPGQAREKLAMEAAPSRELLKAADELGIRDYLQPDHVTTSQTFRELSQAAKSIPGSELRAQEIDGLVKIGEEANKIINKMGGSGDFSELNSNVKSALEKSIDGISLSGEGLYKKVSEKIPKKLEVNPNATIQFLKNRAEELGGADKLSASERKLLKDLSPTPIKNEQGVIVGYKNPTYALLDERRKEIGAATKGKGQFADNASYLNDNLYRVLAEDQFLVAEQFGVADVYKAAQKTVQVKKSMQNDMQALFGKKLDQSLMNPLRTSVNLLSKGDDARFTKLIESIPKNLRQQTVATGLTTAFGKATKNGELNFNTYANWYEGLQKNKNAYRKLFDNLPDGSEKQMRNLYLISDGIRKANREFIGTGRIMAVNEQLRNADNILSGLFEVAKRASVSIPAEFATTSIGLPGAGIASGITAALMKGKPDTLKSIDKLLASPAFQNAIVSMSVSPKSPKTKKIISGLVKTPQFLDFAKKAKLPGSTADYELFMANIAAQNEQEEK